MNTARITKSQNPADFRLMAGRVKYQMTAMITSVISAEGITVSGTKPPAFQKFPMPFALITITFFFMGNTSGQILVCFLKKGYSLCCTLTIVSYPHTQQMRA